MTSHGKCQLCGQWKEDSQCQAKSLKDCRMIDHPRVWNKYDPKCPAGAVYVGRGSPWGNPFRISFAQDRQSVIERFRCETLPKLDVTKLKGKHLVCYCAPRPCHADLLLAAANRS